MQIELKFDRKQNARASSDFPEKKTPKATHTTGHIQMDKQKDIRKNSKGNPPISYY